MYSISFNKKMPALYQNTLCRICHTKLPYDVQILKPNIINQNWVTLDIHHGEIKILIIPNLMKRFEIFFTTPTTYITRRIKFSSAHKIHCTRVCGREFVTVPEFC